MVNVTAQFIQKKRKMGTLQQAVKPAVVERPSELDNIYAVSENQEVYVCINATNKEHECDYGMCRSCYFRNEPSRGKRSRRKDYDIDDSECNHKCLHTLQQFFDREFFKKDYMQQIKERKIAWTSKCGICGVLFVAQNKKGKIM